MNTLIGTISKKIDFGFPVPVCEGILITVLTSGLSDKVGIVEVFSL